LGPLECEQPEIGAAGSTCSAPGLERERVERELGTECLFGILPPPVRLIDVRERGIRARVARVASDERARERLAALVLTGKEGIEDFLLLAFVLGQARAVPIQQRR